MPEPQQSRIWATSATYTPAHGNAGFLTHLVRPGFELATSSFLVRFINRWAATGTPCFVLIDFFKERFQVHSQVEQKVQRIPERHNFFPEPTSPIPAVDLFTVSRVLPFPDCHVIGIIEHGVLSDWLLLSRSMHLNFLHVLSWLDSSFLFSSE